MNIFIHGWSFSKYIWKDFNKIENSIFLDIPFHGDLKDFPTENIIDNYIDYLSEKIPENSTVIGWSIGASIGVLLSIKYPEKVNKLILIGFSPKFNDKNLGSNPKFIKAFFLSLNKDFENTIYNFRKTSSDNKFLDIPLPEKKGSILILKEFVNLDLTDKVKSINKEIVLIHGKQDKIVNPYASKWVKKQLENKPTLILVDTHHSPFLKNSDLIVNLI